ncbi:hypothetical protein STEG23_014257 [Scotinomys teguina]
MNGCPSQASVAAGVCVLSAVKKPRLTHHKAPPIKAQIDWNCESCENQQPKVSFLFAGLSRWYIAYQENNSSHFQNCVNILEVLDKKS